MGKVSNFVELVKKYGMGFMFWETVTLLGCDRSDKVNQIVATYYEGLTQKEREEDLKTWFFKCTGNNLNLENPQTFNEKIQWMKLYDSTPLKTRLADKYLVREWIREQIGEKYLIPLVGG